MNNLSSTHNSSSSSYSWSINMSSESFPCARNRGRVVMNARRSLYDLLELHPQVGISDIKRSYRRLALKTHPDVCPSHIRKEDSTTRFREIQEAYETLSDPRRRAIYDHGRLSSSSSSSTSRSSWNKETQPLAGWKTQLSELKHWSSQKSQKSDTWATLVRKLNAHRDNQHNL